METKKDNIIHHYVENIQAIIDDDTKNIDKIGSHTIEKNMKQDQINDILNENKEIQFMNSSDNIENIGSLNSIENIDLDKIENNKEVVLSPSSEIKEVDDMIIQRRKQAEIELNNKQ